MSLIAYAKRATQEYGSLNTRYRTFFYGTGLVLLLLLTVPRWLTAIGMNRLWLQMLASIDWESVPFPDPETLFWSERCDGELATLPSSDFNIISDEPLAKSRIVIAVFCDSANVLDIPEEAWANIEGGHWYAGRAHYLLGQPDRALAHWRRLPNTDILFAKVGASIYFSNDENGPKIEKALAYFALANRLQNRVVAAKAPMYRAQHQIYRDAQSDNYDLSAAFQAAENLLAVEPTPANHLIVANMLLSKGDYAESKKILDALRLRWPKFDRFHYSLGRTYLGLGDLAAALPEFEGVSTSEASYPLARLAIAQIHYSLGDVEKAEAEAIKVLESENPRAVRGARLLLRDIAKE